MRVMRYLGLLWVGAKINERRIIMGLLIANAVRCPYSDCRAVHEPQSDGADEGERTYYFRFSKCNRTYAVWV